MKFSIFVAIFAAIVIFFPASAHADPIGTVVEIEGAATISRGGGAAFALALNDRVETGDVVATGAKSRLFILLADNTEWTLSENSKFRVDEYLFDSEDNSENKARYSASGGFRYVSGLVAKKENPDVSISSAAGTIGIRGTDITVAPDADGSYDVYVDDGTIDVASGGANARLQRGQGTMVAKHGAPPIAPKDWKPARLERMRGALKLARGGEMRERIEKMQPQQMEMRQKLREKIMERREQIKENKEGRREDRHEERMEKREERKDRVQEWKEHFKEGREDGQQPQNGQMQNGQFREQLRDKMQQRQDGQGFQPMNGQPQNGQPQNGQFREQLRDKIQQRQDGQGFQPMNGQPQNGQFREQLRDKIQQRQDGQNPPPVNPPPQGVNQPMQQRPLLNKIRPAQ
jgi:hypothetical protein